jgi:hypothetical protein
VTTPYRGPMDEERVSRPHAHPLRAPSTTRDVGIPEQRTPREGAPDPVFVPVPDLPVGPVMSLARLTLAVIFGMLLFGLVASFILTRG